MKGNLAAEKVSIYLKQKKMSGVGTFRRYVRAAMVGGGLAYPMCVRVGRMTLLIH